MTPAEEIEFIALWNQGLEIAVMAQRLGIPRGTVQSRAHCLQRRGLIQPQPKGGAYPRQKVLARQDGSPATPVTPAPPAPRAAERKDIQQWTVRLSKALIEHLKAVGYERRNPPSQLVEELLWKALTDQLPSPS
jgi:DNA-binding transcriptional MocR family regulator